MVIRHILRVEIDKMHYLWSHQLKVLRKLVVPALKLALTLRLIPALKFVFSFEVGTSLEFEASFEVGTSLIVSTSLEVTTHTL